MAERYNKRWTADELVQAYRMREKGFPGKKVGRELGRTSDGIYVAMEKLRAKMDGDDKRKYSHAYADAANILMGEPVLVDDNHNHHTHTHHQPVLDDKWQESQELVEAINNLSDYIDNFKAGLLSRVGELALASTQDVYRQADDLMVQNSLLVRENQELTEQNQKLLKVVEAAKTDNTKDMLEKALGGLFRKK